MIADLLYGSPINDLDKTRLLVETILNVRFEERESIYRAGRYFSAIGIAKEKLTIQKNLDVIDNEPQEKNFSEIPILIYVESTEREDELRILFDIHSKEIQLLRKSS